MKKLKVLLGMALGGWFLLSSNAIAFDRVVLNDVRHVTKINGEKYTLQQPSFAQREHRKVLKTLEKAAAESNKITEAYLKTNSPAWKDLNTEEFRANNNVFREVWYRIVAERHYDKNVLDAYEKFKAMQLKNHEKMFKHFFKLSSNEPFKEKVRVGIDNSLAIFKDDLNVIKHLRTYL